MKRISKIEEKYVREVLKSEFRSSKATNMVSRAEAAFANATDSKFAIGFTNGTATLHAALEAIGIEPGDEVIVPPLTMAATCMAVLQANATPIFADVDLKTWQISAESIARNISDRTKAIITVALYGGSPDYYAIKSVSKGIPIIEDNAEAIGTKYDGKLIGNFGDFSSYSFQSSKHLSSGEGGMLCLNSTEIANKVRRIQSLGYKGLSAEQGKILKSDIQNPEYERHESLGWNYRMSDITAAVVLGQTERLDELIKVRMKSAHILAEAVADYNWIKPQGIYDNSTHSYWAFPVTIERKDVSWGDFSNKFREFGGKGIYAAWKLNYKEPMFQNLNLLGREHFISAENCLKYLQDLCPNAENLQPKILAFRTNEWHDKAARSQQKSLIETLRFFQNKRMET